MRSRIRAWWKRKKAEAKKNTRHIFLLIIEHFAYGSVIIGLLDLDLGVASWAGVYVTTFFISMHSPFVYDDDIESLPSPVVVFAKRFDIVDWFDFEFRAFITRILIFAFVITCVAGLVAVGISEELALAASLSILALSLPTYLVYYVLSSNSQNNEPGAED
jgi:hypothetical protein